MMRLIRWWHLQVLHHRPERWLTLAASRVVTCECGTEWVEPR